MGGPVVRPALVPTSAEKANLLRSLMDSPAVNNVPVWNGSQWVPAAPGTSFTFAVSSFSDGQSSPQLMGPAGTQWKAAGALTFTAAYSNGPPAWAYAYINSGGSWNNTLDFADPFTSVVSTEPANYPAAAGDSIEFAILAYKGPGINDSDIASHSVAFANYIYYGVLAKASGYDEADVESLTPGASPELSNTVGRTITLNAGTGEHLIFALPARLGEVELWVGGIDQTGAFNLQTPLSITNSAGYTEDYHVYSSINSGLGSTTIEVR